MAKKFLQNDAGTRTWEEHPDIPDAHHPAAVAQGRLKIGATIFLSVPGQSGYLDGFQAFTADKIYYVPIYVRTPITIDGVTLEVMAAAGAGEKCRMAIYAADTDWQPTGNKLVASAEIAIDAVAPVSTALADTTLPAGRYLLAMIAEGGVGLRSVIGSGTLMGYRTTVNTTPFIIGSSVAQAYGALPDPATVADTPIYGGTGVETYLFLEVLTP